MITIKYYGVTNFGSFHYICSSNVKKSPKLLRKKVLSFTLDYFKMNLDNVLAKKRNSLHLKNPVINRGIEFVRIQAQYI